MNPGIYPDLGFADYLTTDAASKSKLRELWKRTPSHCLAAEDESTPEQDFGTALHVAVLEPDKFPLAVVRGPKDRRGNAWKEALAEHASALVLPDHEYDRVLRARDAVMRDPQIKALATLDGLSEASAFWIDPETGLLCRMRTDRYVPKLALMADLKTTTNASLEAFARIAEDMLYDLHDAMYSEGWNRAGGGEVEDFIFVAIERDPPFAHQVFQYEPPERNRGRQIMRKALRRYAECKATGVWPGYPSGVTRLSYREFVHQRDAISGLYTEEEAA